jgi:hypothetical protein
MKTRIRNEAKAWLREVEAELREWDPLMVIQAQRESGLPESEYDSYAPGVLTLLLRTPSASELAAHLGAIRKEEMEVSPDPDRDQLAATRILRWWKAQRGLQ